MPEAARLRRTSISSRMLVIIMGMSLLISVLLTVGLAAAEYHAAVAVLQGTLAQVERTQTGAMAKAVWDFNSEQIFWQAEGILSYPHITYVAVRGDAGMLVERGQRPEGQPIEQDITLTMQDEGVVRKIGSLLVVADSSHIMQDVLQNARWAFLTQTLLVFSIAVVFFVLQKKMVLRHLSRLAAYFSSFEMGRGGEGFRLDKKPRNDELDVMVASFNEMRGKLEVSFKEKITAQLEAKRSADQLQAVVENAGDAIYLADMSGRLVAVNTEAERQTGYTRDELLGMRVMDLDAVESPESYGQLADLLAGGRHIVFESTHRRKDGGLLPVEVRAVYFEAEGGGYLLGIARDISSRKRMQEMLIQTEKMMSVGGLAAGMAHEINNPLSGILQSAQVIRSRLTEETSGNLESAAASGCDLAVLREYLQRRGILKMLENIKSSAQRAADVVSNMLEFGRKVDRDAPAEDVNQLADNALKQCAADYDLSKTYGFKAMEVVKDYDSGLQPVHCAGSQIQQAFVQLLRNCVHALAEGGAQRDKRIVIRTRQVKEAVRVEIEDNGPGMNEETRKHAFDPFFTTKSPGEGAGLGLSVSYYIICNQHDGSLQVESEPGAGAKFIIELPLAPKSSRGGRNWSGTLNAR